jgi:hypothetical protein
MPEWFVEVVKNPWSIFACVGALWVVCATVDSILKNFARERSRREIAAYIAEGSMTAEEGERLMASKPDDDCCSG